MESNHRMNDKRDVIGGNLVRTSKEYPEKVAIYYGEQTITYQAFAKRVSFYQAFLLEKVDAMDKPKVALLISNEPVFLEIYFAVIMLGWTAIPFDGKWTESEAVYVEEMSKPTIIVKSKAFMKVASYDFPQAFLIDELSDASLSTREIEIIPSCEPFYIGFTSGSTGFPKGYIRGQQSWLRSFEAGESIFGYGPGSTLMAPGPICHSLSLFGATHALHIGASFCLTPNFIPQHVFEKIEAGVVTVMYGVPTMFHSLAKLQKRSTKPITFLSSGAKLQSEVKQGLRAVFPNAQIFEYFGASELSYVTYATDTFNEKYPESVGRPFQSVKISIRDEAGGVLPSNEIGEIYIESDFLFSGYVQNELATRQALTKNGAYIGDIGFLSESGALTIIGRKNNMMIAGGQNVYPEEVEKIIKMSNAVKEAVVIGVDDLHWGKRIFALVKWKDTNETNVNELKGLCKAHLPNYKRPRRYVSVEEFSFTHTGKIARNEILKNVTRWIR